MNKGELEGRVAIVSGAGRGLGRSHALALARHGAMVIVNDKGGDLHGEGQDATPAQQVVGEIEGFGGRAAVSGHDVSRLGPGGRSRGLRPAKVWATSTFSSTTPESCAIGRSPI